jgi:hypothetical protein
MKNCSSPNINRMIKSRIKAGHAAHTGNIRKAYISIYLCTVYTTTLS